MSHQSPETKRKISEALKGHAPNQTSFKPGNLPWNKGKKGLDLNPEGRGRFHAGHIPWNKGKKDEYCLNTSSNHWEKRNEKISKAMQGENNHQWKGGVTRWRQALNNSPEYKEWRQKVYRRDKWSCQKCGKRSHGKGGEIHAHHIIPVSENHDLIFDIENGITLCPDCHQIIHLERGDKYGFYIAASN